MAPLNFDPFRIFFSSRVEDTQREMLPKSAETGRDIKAFGRDMVKEHKEQPQEVSGEDLVSAIGTLVFKAIVIQLGATIAVRVCSLLFKKGSAAWSSKRAREKLPHRRDLDWDNLCFTSHEIEVLKDVVMPNSIKTTFDMIGGMQDVKHEVRDMVTLACSEEARQQGILSTKGILLSGPPGTGKTLLAKAIAEDCQVTFINVTTSSLNSKWVGESAKYISAVFSLARKLAPTIIFIDEIDCFLAKRNGTEMAHTLGIKAEFMSGWDGLLSDIDEPIIVLATTNRPQDVDPAILRRLQSRFVIGLPSTANERFCILRKLTRKFKMASDVNLMVVATATEGYSGSDLQALCQAAQMVPAREFAAQMRTTRGAERAILRLRPITNADLLLALRIARPAGDHADMFAEATASASDGRRAGDVEQATWDSERWRVFIQRLRLAAATRTTPADVERRNSMLGQ